MNVKDKDTQFQAWLEVMTEWAHEAKSHGGTFVRLSGRYGENFAVSYAPAVIFHRRERASAGRISMLANVARASLSVLRRWFSA